VPGSERIVDGARKLRSALTGGGQGGERVIARMRRIGVLLVRLADAILPRPAPDRIGPGLIASQSASGDAALRPTRCSETMLPDDRRDRRVAILGYDSNTPAVLKIAIALGLQPVALHAPNGAIEAGTTLRLSRREIEDFGGDPGGSATADSVSIDVVSRDDFARALADESITLLIGATETADRDWFRENVLLARNRLWFTGKILHPACFCDHYRYPDRRFAMIGFPGSGT